MVVNWTVERLEGLTSEDAMVFDCVRGTRWFVPLPVIPIGMLSGLVSVWYKEWRRKLWQAAARVGVEVWKD
jgi:hypothetical protein